MKSLSYILVISEQNDCTDVIKQASLGRINEANVMRVDEPAEGMSVLAKIGLVDSKLPVCIFLSTDIAESKIKSFLDLLDRQYRDVTKGKVVLVNPRLRLKSLMKFAMSEAVGQFINSPVLPIEVEAVLKTETPTVHMISLD